MRDTFGPINSKTLSKTEYDKVLESHLFLKQKRDQSIKEIMVAGGNKQRGHIDKTDATSPTAALESVLLTSTIDVYLMPSNIKSIGFEFHPYDPCFANNIVNGAQLTVVWHVYDLNAEDLRTPIS